MGNRLYVGNLSFHVNTDGLRAAFAECGEVVDVHVATDRGTGQARGFGFRHDGQRAQEAAAAITKLNGAQRDGRELRVNDAEERPARGGGGGGGGIRWRRRRIRLRRRWRRWLRRRRRRSWRRW